MNNRTNKKKIKLFDITKKKTAAAVVVAAVLILSMSLAIAGEGSNLNYMATCIILILASVLFLFLNLHFGGIISLILLIIAPVASLVALENYTSIITNLSTKILILNLLFFYLLYGLMIFLLGNIFRGTLIATLIPMLFGLANYFVVSFRGTPIVPWDIYSVRTAVSVADNYSFTINWKVCFSLFVFIWIILLFSKSTVKFKNLKIRIPSAALFLLCFCLYIVGIQDSSIQSYFGMDTTLFTINVFYRNNGTAAAFLGNLRFLRVEEPNGYSEKKAEEIADAYAEPEEDQNENLEASELAEYPNIIVIMNEAFSDLSVWGDFTTSEEVLPVLHELQDEGIGGEVYVSVKGGNTANTEYELLTGDTMGFLPAGSVPYQQYIKSDMPSLASYLGNLGYDTLAIHPYNASGWDRDKVYDYFGFDTFLSKDDFVNPVMMRDYISDQSAFEKIIEQYEEKDEGSKLFVFEVTMQNHSGYSKNSPGFDIYVTLPDVTFSSTQVIALEKYLTLMRESDKALGELCDYFRNVDEPTIILMLGDHQPSDYITNMVRRICGVDEPETLEEIQQGYRVPFVIWANYDIDHEYYDGISVNYLSSILLETANVPLTGYQEYLLDLMETLPIINANVYRDSSGEFYSISEKGLYDDLLNNYQILDYNHLIDSKNRLNWFFEE